MRVYIWYQVNSDYRTIGLYNRMFKKFIVWDFPRIQSLVFQGVIDRVNCLNPGGHQSSNFSYFPGTSRLSTRGLGFFQPRSNYEKLFAWSAWWLDDTGPEHPNWSIFWWDAAEHSIPVILIRVGCIYRQRAMLKGSEPWVDEQKYQSFYLTVSKLWSKDRPVVDLLVSQFPKIDQMVPFCR